MTSMPSIGAAARSSTADASFAGASATTFAHQCMPYVKYT